VIYIYRIEDPKAMGLSETIVRKGTVVCATQVSAYRWRVSYADLDFPIIQEDLDGGLVRLLGTYNEE
jgi:hypothetical protein